MGPAVDPRIRNIKIKTGVVKRLTKEKSMYEQEAQKLEEKVQQMKVDGKDEHDIKKQTEVADESKMMIPDTIRRLNTASTELQTLLNTEEDLKDSEEYKLANECLKAAKAAVA